MKRVTVAQALIAFLKRQVVEWDGQVTPFFAGVLGIFGHGNVAGIGEALQGSSLPYILTRNEQAQVHIAAGFAKQSRRRRAFACTSSIGPGATNMVTGAALATINRLPVLLLPGDTFATRRVAPLLQELEHPLSRTISVNDAFRPVCRYFDRILRPEQLPSSLLEAMRVLTSCEETGAVALALPQDVQAEAAAYPQELFRKRVWRVRRPLPEKGALRQAAARLRAARAPLLIVGGGVHYSEAFSELKRFVEETGIPFGETQAGKGALPFDHPQNMGGIGVTGGLAANTLAREADCLFAVGTRLTDFTTASQSLFQHPRVRFVHLNIAPQDAQKLGALPLVADAREGLAALRRELRGFEVSRAYRQRASRLQKRWWKTCAQLVENTSKPLTQAAVLSLLNDFISSHDTIVASAGSLPGDCHKLYRCRAPGEYHVEYGYSCMGYEVAGAIGAKMAKPKGEVYALVGDGSFFMLSSELVTALQEGIAIRCILFDNHGFGSIGGLSESLGQKGYGTEYRSKVRGELRGGFLPTDFVKLAEGYGAWAVRAGSQEELLAALKEARRVSKPAVIVVEVARGERVPSFAPWDVPVASVSEKESVQKRYAAYQKEVAKERSFL